MQRSLRNADINTTDIYNMQYAASTIILCLILNGERTDPLGKRFSGRLFNKKKKNILPNID